MVKKAGGIFGNFFGVSIEKLEDAAEQFSRAGNGFKAAKKWDMAAKSYQRSAECHVKTKDESAAATAYIECARCFIKAGDGKSGTEVLENEALPRIVDAGRLSQAAKLEAEVGEMFEAEGDYQSAINHYTQAADYHNAENAPSSAQKCLIRVAHLSAQLDPPDFEKASELFEQVGTESLSSNLLKFSAKSHFFNGFLCVLARGDAVSAENALNKAKEQDYTFEGCREAKLADDILTAFKDMDVDAFTDALYNYDQISKLDPWRTTILLKIKQQMGDGGAGGGEEGVDLT
jgi:alpha-soluble NSF attachment protein